MKRIIRLCILIASSSILLLSGCDIHSYSSYTNDKNYNDYISLHILWEEMFNQIDYNYLVYVYSISCGHCKQIESDMFRFIDLNISPIYLIEYKDYIPKTNKVETTIGLTAIEGLAILGTPSLLEIENAQVKNNLGGSNKILEFIYKYLSPS